MNEEDIKAMMKALADFKLLEGRYEQMKAENKRLIAQNDKLIDQLERDSGNQPNTNSNSISNELVDGEESSRCKHVEKYRSSCPHCAPDDQSQESQLNDEGIADLEMRFEVLIGDYRILHTALTKLSNTHANPTIHDALRSVNDCWVPDESRHRNND